MTRKTEFIEKKGKIALHIIAFIYAAVLAYLAFTRLFDNDYWSDEVFSILIVRRSVWGIIVRTAQDVHPPLYYIILKFIAMLGGYKPYTFHLASWIAFVLILLFALLFIWKKMGCWSAVSVITFSFFLDYSITYTKEARMYEWAALFMLMSAAFLYCIFKENRKVWYILFLITTVAAAYTHYYCVLTVALLYIGLLIYAFTHKTDFFKPTMIISIIAIAAYSLWMPVVIKTFIVSNNGGSWMTGYVHFWECFKSVFSGQISVALWIITAILFVLFVVKNKKNIDTYYVILCVAGTLGTIVIPVLISIFVEPILLDRYIYPSSAMMWLMVGYMISDFKDWKVRTVLAVALSIFIIYAQRPVFIYAKQCDQSGQAALDETLADFDKYIPKGITLIADDDQLAVLSRYYMPDNTVDYAETIIDENGNADSTPGEIWALSDDAVDNSPIINLMNERGGEILASNLFYGTHRISIVRIDALDE